MEKFMKHEEHGVMKVYDAATLKENKRNGWEEMSKPEVEKYCRPGKPVIPKEPLVGEGTIEVTKGNQYVTELLEKPIKDIIPELEEMSLDELSELLESETTGQNRSTLIKEISEELELREMQANANRQ